MKLVTTATVHCSKVLSVVQKQQDDASYFHLAIDGKTVSEVALSLAHATLAAWKQKGLLPIMLLQHVCYYALAVDDGDDDDDDDGCVVAQSTELSDSGIPLRQEH
eukprot:5498949-Amphidinium_carterae.1